MGEFCECCAIANREWTCHIVYEDDNLLVFVDHAPIRRGHLQIIPKQHFDYFDDLPPALAAQIVFFGSTARQMLEVGVQGRTRGLRLHRK